MVLSLILVYIESFIIRSEENISIKLAYLDEIVIKALLVFIEKIKTLQER